MIRADWIAVDWGTTRLRAWAMADSGAILQSAWSDLGMGVLHAGRESYEAALLSLVGPWLADGVTTDIVVCGMAGSRQGWIEAPYRPAPAAIASCSPALTRAPTHDSRLRVHIVGGISQASPPDVLRGEETALAGLLRIFPNFAGTVILPGTHNKWVQIADGRIAKFTSFLTGELFALLAETSILRHSVANDGLDEDAFADALQETIAAPESVMTRLFAIRARHLLSGAEPAAAASRLSGYMLGLEIAGAGAYLDAPATVVVSSGPMAERYRIAFRIITTSIRILAPQDCVLEGLRAVHTSLASDEGRSGFET